MPFYRPDIGPLILLLSFSIPKGDQDRPEEKTHEAEAAPSPGSLLHDGDLLFREAVQLVNQGVDLLICRLYLPRKEGLLVAGLSIRKAA